MTKHATPAPGSPEAIKFTDFTAWFVRHLSDFQEIQARVTVCAADFPRNAVSTSILDRPQFSHFSELEADPSFGRLEALVSTLPDGSLTPAAAQALQMDEAQAARFDGSRIKALLDLVKTFWPIIKMFFPDVPDLPGLTPAAG